ncbi:MAG: hypothetical protein R3F56_23605 [Planctomycetota bacterium]
MAQGLRAREDEVGTRARAARALRLPGVLTLTWIAACSDATPELAPLPQDAQAAVRTLLQRWHGPLQGTLATFVTELRDTAGDGPCAKVAFADGRLRVDRPDRSVDLLVGDDAWHCPPDAPAQRLDEAGRRALDDLRALLAGAYLLPLYDARAVARQGPSVLAVAAKDGTTWRLELDLDRQQPKTMTGPAGTVGFAKFFATGVSELPAEVRLGALGTRHLRLVASDILFESFVFQDPTADPSTARKRSAAPRLEVGDDRPTEPVVRHIDSTLFLALKDPGDWQARAERIVAAGTELGEQGQFGAGLPFFFEADGARWIGLPFEPDREQGSPPFRARPGQDARRRARHAAVVLYRAGAPYDAACDEAANRVRAFAERNRLTPDGPLRALAYFGWGDAAPTEAQLQSMPVQVELPIAEPPR